MISSTLVQRPEPLPPATIVIFGATGDLTARLLTPALISLRRQGRLDDTHAILGIGIEPGDGAMLRNKLGAFNVPEGSEGAIEKAQPGMT